jgi:hypothetical protein
MHKYLHKYLKYKSKYINLIYGGVGTPPSTPLKNKSIPTTFSTPIYSTPDINSSLGTPSSTTAAPSTPQQMIEPVLLTRLIEKKDEFVCLLLECLNSSKYKITARATKTIRAQLYIDIKKNKKDFVHFSFHYPDEEVGLQDMFVANTFHLKLDINQDIVFNLFLENDIYKLKSKLDNCEIILKIGDVNFNDVKEII